MKGLEAEGSAADAAPTGTDRLWMARVNPYDAIALDIMLPGMSGYRVCAARPRTGERDADPRRHVGAMEVLWGGLFLVPDGNHLEYRRSPATG